MTTETTPPVTPPTTPPATPPPAPEIIESHSRVSATKDESVVDFDSIDNLEDIPLLPTTRDGILETSRIEYAKPADDDTTEVSAAAELAIGVGYIGKRVATPDGTYDKSINSGDFVNNITYGDKNLGTRHIPTNSDGNLSGAGIIAKFASKLGIGENTQVPLYHSGIWVTITPPRDIDIINLQMEIAANEVRLGRDTSTLIYSNYNVVFTRIVFDFVMKHVKNSTVNMSDERTLRDIIKVTDLFPLIMGMVSAMFPTGYEYIRSCRMSTIIKDGAPSCSHTSKGTLDPTLLTQVNRGILTSENLAHMAKRIPGSVSLDEVMAYQNRLRANASEDILLTSGNGSEFTFTIESPYIGPYIDSGELWVSKIISGAEELFAEGDSDTLQAQRVEDALQSVLMGNYGSYTSKVSSGGISAEGAVDIQELLATMSSDHTISEAYLASVKKYINTHVVSIVAIPSYICPSCVSRGEDGDQGTSEFVGFEEFIPVNVFDHFFDLGGLRVRKVRSRNMS